MTKSLLGRNLNNYILYAVALLNLINISLIKCAQLQEEDDKSINPGNPNSSIDQNGIYNSNQSPEEGAPDEGGINLLQPGETRGEHPVDPLTAVPDLVETTFSEKFQGIKSGFLASFSMILVSEIADKTFFIAAILSGTFNKWIVFAGSFSSLVLQTVLSVAVGQVLLTFLKIEIAELISNALFIIFGCIALKDGVQMKNNDETEMREVEQELKERGFDGEDRGEQASRDVEASRPIRGQRSETNASTRASMTSLTSATASWKKCACFALIFNKIFIQAFTMTFIAEWGDRSQIATINLAATHHAVAVCLGGIIGHGICTSVACIGGSLFATKINAKTITIIGALFFLAFGAYGLIKMHLDDKYAEIFGGGEGGE